MAKFIFKKAPCFHHIFLRLKHGNYPLRGSNNIQVATWNYNNLLARTFYGDRKYITIESCKSYLSNKEQNTMFSVVSRLDGHLGFALPFFVCPNDRADENGRPKNQGRQMKFAQVWIIQSKNKNQFPVFVRNLWQSMYFQLLVRIKAW